MMRLWAWHRRHASECVWVFATLFIVGANIVLSSGHSGFQSRWDRFNQTGGPYLVAIVFAMLMTSLLAAANEHALKKRMRHRLAAGLCPACGYDLRASTERCPECGREIA